MAKTVKLHQSPHTSPLYSLSLICAEESDRIAIQTFSNELGDFFHSKSPKRAKPDYTLHEEFSGHIPLCFFEADENALGEIWDNSLPAGKYHSIHFTQCCLTPHEYNHTFWLAANHDIASLSASVIQKIMPPAQVLSRRRYIPQLNLGVYNLMKITPAEARDYANQKAREGKMLNQDIPVTLALGRVGEYQTFTEIIHI